MQQQQLPSYQSLYGAEEPQPMQAQMPASPYGAAFWGGSAPSGAGLGTLIPPPKEDEEKPLQAVVITVHTGSSYDPLFRRQQQRAPDGRVAVYDLTFTALGPLAKLLLNGEETDSELLQELQRDVEAVEQQSVVLNFECCSGCGDHGFEQISSNAMRLTAGMVERGHMVMFSDFSLKALIGSWDAELLGPNPFVKTGEFSDSMELRFDTSVLKKCPSPQLANVGLMCEEGKATVKALGGTIAFSVNPKRESTKQYTLDVLTVATKLEGQKPKKPLTKAGRHSGAAGHVLMKYKSGGTILCSAGHWIELVQLDVTEAGLLQAAAEVYGQERVAAYSAQLASCSSAESRRTAVQQLACQQVQMQSPCAYSAVRR